MKTLLEESKAENENTASLIERIKNGEEPELKAKLDTLRAKVNNSASNPEIEINLPAYTTMHLA